MSLRVSICCGGSATARGCPYKTPKLVDIAVDMTVLENAPLLPRRSSGEDVIAPLGNHLAARFAHETDSSSCIIFSSLQNSCVFGECREEMHAVDAFLAGSPVSGRLMCHHASEPFANLALVDNNIVISNCPLTDPRVPCAFPTSHEHVRSVMVVPLFIGKLSTAKRVGAIMMINKNNQSDVCCTGYSPKDYISIHTLLAELTIKLYTDYYEESLADLRRQYEMERTHHLAEMSKLSHSRDTFIATMSHEIRTPLNAVNGYNEILSSNRGHVDMAKCLRKQREAILQLTQLIANILDFTKLKSDSLKLTSKPFAIRDVAQRSIDICQVDCAAKNLNLTVHINKNVPETLLGDEVRLHQVFLNLLTNAVKYTSHGGDIHVEINCTSVDDCGGLVQIQAAVVDTGRGIPASLQKRIFDDFQQIRDNAETSASVQGVGLGLAICKELVRLMKGAIWVESDGHSGSKFVFTAIFRDLCGMETLLTTARDVLRDAAVLIVDDKEVNRIILTKMFIEWGFRPHACSTIDEAVQLLEAFPEMYFRVSLIDIDIAGESGLGLVRIITQKPTHFRMLLIGVSSMGKDFVGVEEFDAVHEKPIQPDYLLADIVKLSQIGPVRKSSTISSRALPPTTKTASRRVKRFLIVDDDGPSRQVTAEMIENLGYDKSGLFVASSAKEALRILRDQNNIQCVIMDLVMPDMSGIECIRAIRQDSAKYGSPTILALTADAVDSTKTLALEAGANKFMSKPVSMSDLGEFIGSVFPTAATKTARKKKKKLRDDAIKMRVRTW